MTEPTTPVAPLVVRTDDLARRLGLPVPLDEETRQLLADAIRDAQADVEGYLVRTIVPVPVTQTGMVPWSFGWDFDRDDVVEVLTAVAETYADGSLTGTFAVTYTAGLDARTDPQLAPIRRYVLAAAANSPQVVELWEHYRETSGARGAMTNLATEGQSVSFARTTLGGGGTAGSGAPGALPAIETLAPWRSPGVFQRRTRVYLGP